MPPMCRIATDVAAVTAALTPSSVAMLGRVAPALKATPTPARAKSVRPSAESLPDAINWSMASEPMRTRSWISPSEMRFAPLTVPVHVVTL